MKNKLREIREKRKLSQNQLSKLSSVPQGQISKIESGREMRESDIRKFCTALECNADYLLGLIEEDEE